MMSPTARSLAYLRKEGWTAGVVERRLPHSNITHDLYGFIDIVAIKGTETLAVQTTTGAHVANRVKKIADADTLPLVREAGWTIHVHGWRKLATGRWEVKVVDVS